MALHAKIPIILTKHLNQT